MKRILATMSFLLAFIYSYSQVKMETIMIGEDKVITPCYDNLLKLLSFNKDNFKNCMQQYNYMLKIDDDNKTQYKLNLENPLSLNIFFCTRDNKQLNANGNIISNNTILTYQTVIEIPKTTQILDALFSNLEKEIIYHNPNSDSMTVNGIKMYIIEVNQHDVSIGINFATRNVFIFYMSNAESSAETQPSAGVSEKKNDEYQLSAEEIKRIQEGTRKMQQELDKSWYRKFEGYWVDSLCTNKSLSNQINTELIVSKHVDGTYQLSGEGTIWDDNERGYKYITINAEGRRINNNSQDTYLFVTKSLLYKRKRNYLHGTLTIEAKVTNFIFEGYYSIKFDNGEIHNGTISMSKADINSSKIRLRR